ncbi:hypothetical protein TNCV_1075831 [Trichonephila clavipes]|uniref:Uncharacterized protein n=1 Tax=Trichonephila clavipes TaxID=2585209 RepID=A0A8X6SUC7_TRICX|nr:hypothetical protein TNCV_1075831 [Trichonephila clavipes]
MLDPTKYPPRAHGDGLIKISESQSPVGGRSRNHRCRELEHIFLLSSPCINSGGGDKVVSPTIVRQIPSQSFLTRLQQRLSDSGFFLMDIEQRERRVRSPNNNETVFDPIRNNHGTSMWAIASHRDFP